MRDFTELKIAFIFSCSYHVLSKVILTVVDSIQFAWQNCKDKKVNFQVKVEKTNQSRLILLKKLNLFAGLQFRAIINKTNVIVNPLSRK